MVLMLSSQPPDFFLVMDVLKGDHRDGWIARGSAPTGSASGAGMKPAGGVGVKERPFAKGYGMKDPPPTSMVVPVR